MAQNKKALAPQAPVTDLHEAQRLLLRMIFVVALGVWTLAALATPCRGILPNQKPL